MKGLEMFDRAILTAIVHHNHFGVNVCTGTLHGKEALVQEVLHIEIDYDDG